MDFQDVVESRRAINFFDPHKPVEVAVIRRIVEMAANSPSSFNLQPWSLMILTNPEDKQRLQKLAWDQPKVSEAPVVFIVLADRGAWTAGHPFVERNFEEMVRAGSRIPDQRDGFLDACKSLYGETAEKQQAFACKNTGFFAMSLMYAARHYGLHSHPMDGFDHEGVRKAFQIPENYWIPLLLALGHFNQEQKMPRPKWRKTFEEIVVQF